MADSLEMLFGVYAGMIFVLGVIFRDSTIVFITIKLRNHHLEKICSSFFPNTKSKTNDKKKSRRCLLRDPERENELLTSPFSLCHVIVEKKIDPYHPCLV